MKERRLKESKIISCYIKGTNNLGIQYCSKNVNWLVNYSVSNWVDDEDDMKLTS
jgi:hypothetical protein